MSEIHTWRPTLAEEDQATLSDGALLAAHNAGLMYGYSPEEQARLEEILTAKSEQKPFTPTDN